ncbi:hypothetical protein [uncultured Kiloniella sp.]|uniref:hypothetical protein n=1 Tax=uncultured Kiloniella sp. TaxID=1133091 RepID=UPI00261B6106|nr:hypothetical protein [uncultured Kiloniella sp.]
MPLADFTELTKNLVRDQTDKISDADITNAVELAVERYSVDFPRSVVVEITGNGAESIDKPVDAESIQSLERSANISNPFIEFNLRLTPSGEKIYVTGRLTQNEIYWLRYNAVHQLTTAIDTIPKKHRQAVSHFAASVLFESLSGATASDRDGMIIADSVDHDSKAAEYAKRARRHYDLYHNLLGIKPGNQKSAHVTVNWNGPIGGGDYLMHSRLDQ